MNYYERHLGDYAKDTGHLTILEHGAYTLLLDRYYGTEAGIPADQVYRLARARSDDEKLAVDVVLAEFFTLTQENLWVNGRAEEEIEKMKIKINAARNNGKKGGRPKKEAEIPQKEPTENPNETQEKPNGLLMGSETITQPKAHQTPDTSNQTPIKNKDAAASIVSGQAEKTQDHPTGEPKPMTKKEAMDCLIGLGVTRPVAVDWLAVREKKSAKVTQTAIDGIVREASLANMTVNDALKEGCERGWTAFKASWMDKSRQTSRPSPHQLPAPGTGAYGKTTPMTAEEEAELERQNALDPVF